MIILTFYTIFVIINLIICLIITCIDYNNGIAITLKIIGNALLLIFLSILGTLYFIVRFFDVNGNEVTILLIKDSTQNSVNTYITFLTHNQYNINDTIYFVNLK